MTNRNFHQWLNGREKLFPATPHCFVSQSTFDPKRSLSTFRQKWFVKTGAFYRRRDIVVLERPYDEPQIRRLLRGARLQVPNVKAVHKISGKATRLLYLARRPN